MADHESFPTSDGPGDIIFTCEGCENFIYLREKDLEEVFACPICGFLNKLNKKNKNEITRGNLVLKSPLMDVEKDLIEEGRISLPDLPAKVQEALMWLQSHRWKFDFVVNHDDLEN